jgi:uncharacterized membrane protein YkvA (DUF1232 family)
MPKFILARPVQNVLHTLHLLRNRRTMWQMIRESIRGQYRMSFLTKAAIVISVCYIIFPFDLIPDYIPFVGWIDDGIAFYLLMKQLSNETKRFSRFKAMERRGD